MDCARNWEYLDAVKTTMNTQTQHTPTPWTAAGWSSNGTPIIAKDPLKTIARTVAVIPCEYATASRIMLRNANQQADYELRTTKANAAFIVRACNAHEQLVAFAEHMVRYFEENPNGYDDMRQQARAALSAAKE